MHQDSKLNFPLADRRRARARPCLLVLSFFLFFSLSSSARSDEILSWEECLKESAKNHPDLVSAQEVIKQSRAGKKVIASALFPQVGGSAGASVSQAGRSSTKPANSYTYGVTGTQKVFDGFKVHEDVKAASETVKAAEFSYKFISTEVRLRLRTAFVHLLKAQESLKITQDIRKLRRDSLVLISLRYESGIEHKGALMSAEADMASADLDVAKARRALEVAQRQLLKEIGRPHFSPVRVRGALAVSDAVLSKPDFEALAEKNPSLGKLFAQKNAAAFGVKSALANYFPEITAQAGAGKTGTRWPPEYSTWNTGVALSVPVLEGGLRAAQVAQARAEVRQAEADEQSARDGLVVALQETWAALQDAVETVQVRKKFLDAAEERARIAEAQYSIGMIIYDNWTIIEDNLVSSKTALLEAQANALLAEAQWIQAKGETLEYEK